MNTSQHLQAPGGVNVFEAMAQAGHTKPETTMGYMLLDVSRREKAVLDIQQRSCPNRCAGIMREWRNDYSAQTIERIGGPGRVRTVDLFHAILGFWTPSGLRDSIAGTGPRRAFARLQAAFKCCPLETTTMDFHIGRMPRR